MKNIKIKVYGMHCKSCEVLLENNLQSIHGVKINKIDSKNGTLDIDINEDKLIHDIEKQINKSGFSVEQETKSTKNNINDYLIIIIIALVLLIFYFILNNFKLFGFLGSFKEVTIGVAIITGIVASVSSCLAITGGIIIGFSRYIDDSKGIGSHIKVQGSFHLGRIIGFTIMGGLLGLFGGFLGFSVGVYNVLLIIAGVVMFYMGLNILKIVPSITHFGISMPKKLSHKILNIKNPVFAPIVGALTFFLPCGFTQSMQIIAVSSGNFINGAMIMGAFALGTFPVLLLVGIGSSYVKDRKFNLLNKIIGVFIIFFAISILRGASNLISFSNNSTNNNQEITSTNNSNLIEMNVGHNGNNLEPETINLEYGKNYKLIITPTHDGIGCMVTMIIPQINNTVNTIKKGIPIEYDLVNLKKGNYRVVCGTMGMYQGEIVVK
nr:sulfite exporter TauE/SafE family protein [Candidatus Gracilibacteria bacterium]